MVLPSWYIGIVKAVRSGDSLVVMGIPKGDEIPPEMNLTLSYIIAPKLAPRGGVDEPFAWESREFLRKLCVGKEVVFRVDYRVQYIKRHFATVFLELENIAFPQDVALMVVSQGWAKVVKERRWQKGESYHDVDAFLRREEQDKDQGLGKWSKISGVGEASIRDFSNFDAITFVRDNNKAKSIPAIVEQVRDGSTVRVCLPGFKFVRVLVAGIQSPSMGRRLTAAAVLAPPTSGPDPFSREAKHFTEMRVLNRDVRLIPKGLDKFSNLIGNIYYNDGNEAKNLAIELVKHGLAKYFEWSGKCLEDKDRRELKTAEVEAKKQKIRMWTNFVPPPSDSKPIQDQNFTGKVVEVIRGDCVVVADDAVAFRNPLAERRVNLSSIRAPLLSSRDENNIKPENYAHEAKEFLRQKLIGRQVSVSMEYSREVGLENGSADSRVMDFGSVFLSEGDDVGQNISERLVFRGLARVIRHGDFEERSSYYDALLTAEAKAMANKKRIHSTKNSPAEHILDLTTASTKKANDHLPSFQREGRLPAIVEYVLSGYQFKLLIPKKTCSITFSFSDVRCPGQGNTYADEALAFMRRKILQRDVEIEVETVDRNGTFLGSLWESKTNMAAELLENGYAKLQTFVGVDRITDAHLLAHAKASAKCLKIKLWENYVEGQEVVPNETSGRKSRQKQVLKLVVTEILDGCKFYVQSVVDEAVASIQRQLASLDIGEAPSLESFNPKKGDLVLAQFSADNSWYRAMIVNVACGGCAQDELEVFYIDYGNQEVIPHSQLRPLSPSIKCVPGLARLCSLAFIKVPSSGEDYWEQAAEYLHDLTLKSSREFRATIEDKDSSKAHGFGTILLVTLHHEEEEDGPSVKCSNAAGGAGKIREA